LLHHVDIAYAAEPLAYQRGHGSNTTGRTNQVIVDLAFAYAFAGAYERAASDARYTPAVRRDLQRRTRAHVLDVVSNPHGQIPESWRFAVDAIERVVPDGRLRRVAVS
jgi:hypothetical protein